MKDGFLRVASATPEVKVADCTYNGERIIEFIKEAEEKGVSLIVFPELSITAYTCQDLFFQKTLLQAAKKTLLSVAEQTKQLNIISIVGLPLEYGGALYNTAAVVYHGKVLGFIPKQNIPNYGEFHELRFFTKGSDYQTISFYGEEIPFGSELLFCCNTFPEFRFGVEVCEDLWVTNPPSCDLVKCGATVVVNLSASSETVGKDEYRRTLVLGQSARLFSAYLYSDAGTGESTTDLVFSGHNLIAENGVLLSESKRFTTGFITADLDLQRIVAERRRNNNFIEQTAVHSIFFSLPCQEIKLTRSFSRLPFVPTDPKNLYDRCEDILTIQATGLLKRMQHTKIETVILGLSGGLDSTLALLVTIRAFEIGRLSKKGIIAVTMPCFGTTSRTRENAIKLAECCGVTLLEIPIADSVREHFRAISQDETVHDATYENAQARERTQVLMDLANQRNGLVVGTGDLSELALGWATYNGDHMSMYSVNCSIPKTLVKHLVLFEANQASGNKKEILFDILDTPVSPELLPPDKNGISQKTEELVGPYDLHDFYLFYFIRFGFTPKKIFRLASIAFDGIYEKKEIKHWLTVFFRRFFTQQFKRSCLPDGPKVGSVTLSPRGDFRMPSDACFTEWMTEIESISL